jgi:hypothetical protein
MDPIGLALENFDAIAVWRTHDEGAAIDASGELFDTTKVDGPAGLRNWLNGYADQFVSVFAEKLLTYALGRGVEHQDMPLVPDCAASAQATASPPSCSLVTSAVPINVKTGVLFELRRECRGSRPVEEAGRTRLCDVQYQ